MAQIGTQRRPRRGAAHIGLRITAGQGAGAERYFQAFFRRPLDKACWRQGGVSPLTSEAFRICAVSRTERLTAN